MTKKKPKEEELKEFLVTVSTTGRATATVMAIDEKDARDRFWQYSENDEMLEWEYDEILGVEVNE